MSESEQIKSPQSSYNSSDSIGYYVYCVAESIPAEEIVGDAHPAAIEDGADLELIKTDKLTAIVSRVPLSTYGESALSEKLSDATWTAIRAMRHEHVVEYFARKTSVVPLRFGTIYLNRSGVERMLSDKQGQLTSTIQRLNDREEWGVNMFCDRTTLLDNITNVSPRLRGMAEAAKSAPPGQSYLLQKKIEALRTDETKAEVARAADEIESTLKGESDGSVKLRILKVETTEHGELNAKFAFLVPRSRFENFRNAAEHLAQHMESSGIRLELTGPWPAYNFANTDE
ncbi:MAG TPA: GvpL/GvpF family gas vesicle protein [Pyrinomonadaceae bacterium]|jgi:Gas vesicle synthesis protein GvpL/GvpF.|nr:GvpL/GvpF family gas vesicle protein [Pyrinomonadaceae bacterium]